VKGRKITFLFFLFSNFFSKATKLQRIRTAWGEYEQKKRSFFKEKKREKNAARQLITKRNGSNGK
jgi:hypothetical protein